MAEPFGDISLVLRAHLPYAPTSDPAEEEALFRALTFCYLPLLDLFARLAEEGVSLRVGMALSPSLWARLDDPGLSERFTRALNAGEEDARRVPETERAMMARLDATRARFAAAQGDLPGALSALSRAGVLELFPCGLSHALFPLVEARSQKLQARAALSLFESRFSQPAQGLWLPGCAYAPGVEESLAPARYTIVESHGLTRAAPRALHGPFAPAISPNGLVFLARDPDAERQWFGRESGYWQDGDYQPPPMAPWPPFPPRVARNGTAYNPERAAHRAASQAAHFVQERVRVAADLGHRLRRPPLFLLAFEAERFGMAWAEGPLFLEHLLRAIAREPRLRLSTPSQILARETKLQALRPPTSSWAESGGFEPWTTPEDLPHWAACQHLGARLAGTPLSQASRQARRELALAQTVPERPWLPSHADDTARLKARREDHLRAASQCLAIAERRAPEDYFFLESRAALTPRWSLG
jgi:1,4-alpha-glucan branching enzyme